MEKPNDILLGLTRYVRPIFLLFLLLSVSHLILPLLASLNSGSYLFKKHPNPNGISFLYDWSYHLMWVGLVPTMIMLIHVFHGKANKFVHDTLGNYKSNYSEFMGKLYIPIISLIIAAGISFLIYKVNVITYIKDGKTTWWLPNPGGKQPALSTTFFHIWCAVIGSTILVYVIHHIAISINVYRLLGDWTKKGIENMKLTRLLKNFDSMIRYFTSFIYPLLPGVLLCCISIVKRRINLNDPVVILTVIGITVVLFLLYLIPSVATGLASTIGSAKRLIDDKRVERLTIFPSDALFWWAIFSPVWSTIVTIIIRTFFHRVIGRSF